MRYIFNLFIISLQIGLHGDSKISKPLWDKGYCNYQEQAKCYLLFLLKSSPLNENVSQQKIFYFLFKEDYIAYMTGGWKAKNFPLFHYLPNTNEFIVVDSCQAPLSLPPIRLMGCGRWVPAQSPS